MQHRPPSDNSHQTIRSTGIFRYHFRINKDAIVHRVVTVRLGERRLYADEVTVQMAKAIRARCYHSQDKWPCSRLFRVKFYSFKASIQALTARKPESGGYGPQQPSLSHIPLKSFNHLAPYSIRLATSSSPHNTYIRSPRCSVPRHSFPAFVYKSFFPVTCSVKRFIELLHMSSSLLSFVDTLS